MANISTQTQKRLAQKQKQVEGALKYIEPFNAGYSSEFDVSDAARL